MPKSSVPTVGRKSPSTNPRSGPTARHRRAVGDAAEHHRLLDAVESVVDGVGEIVLPHVPRPFGARLGQRVQRPLHIVGLNVPGRLFVHRLAAAVWVGVRVTVSGHVRQQFCRGPGGDVGAQRPGCLRVAHTPEQVGHVVEHVRLVDEAVAGIDLDAVQADRGAAERLQLQAGGGDDDVGIEVLTGFECDTGGVEMVDVVGDHVGAAVGDRGVQVGVGDQAHPLVPRVVPGFEVGVDVVALGQFLDRPAPHEPLHQPGSLRDTKTNTASVNATCIRMSAWEALRGSALRTTAANLLYLDAAIM